jgi:hypothetical protein
MFHNKLDNSCKLITGREILRICKRDHWQRCAQKNTKTAKIAIIIDLLAQLTEHTSSQVGTTLLLWFNNWFVCFANFLASNVGVLFSVANLYLWRKSFDYDLGEQTGTNDSLCQTATALFYALQTIHSYLHLIVPLLLQKPHSNPCPIYDLLRYD